MPRIAWMTIVPRSPTGWQPWRYDSPFPPARRDGYNPGMSDERKKPVWPWIVAALVGTSSLYVGIYALMVTPIQVFHFDPSGMGEPTSSAGYAEPWYLKEGPVSKAHGYLKTAFYPVHESDRHVRRSAWGRRP